MARSRPGPNYPRLKTVKSPRYTLRVFDGQGRATNLDWSYARKQANLEAMKQLLDKHPQVQLLGPKLEVLSTLSRAQGSPPWSAAAALQEAVHVVCEACRPKLQYLERRAKEDE